MSRKFIVLNMVLLALALTLAWQLRARWMDARSKEREMLARQIAAKKALAPAVPGVPTPATPADYLDVAQRTLFSKDRNPNVVVEPPKPEPEAPMPALPHYHGQMAIADPVAFLSISNGPQKGYHVGENVGDFKLSRFDRESIELEWHGKKIEKKVEELIAKDVTPPPAPGAGQPSPQANAAAAPGGAQEVRATGPVTTIIPSASGANGPSVASSGNLPSALGPEIGGGLRACVPSDDSATGTVLSGFKKNIIKSMFGEICRWEPAK